MNIIGEGFHENIITEISRRHKIHGYRANQGLNIDVFNGTVPKVLDYLNSKTGWVKMISSVDIKDINTINSKGIKALQLGGDSLAKNFILFNGVGELGNYNSRGGVMNKDYDIINNKSVNNILAPGKAYGIGDTKVFGQSPMMGITSANIKTETRGSLKTATVQIKAWNKVQFDIIDNLYLRLGYNVLLEWGHSHYFRNDSLTQLEQNSTSLENEYFSGKNYYSLLDIAYKKRIDSFGNYDALIGKVVNFNWTFNTDGSYDIVVILRSQGDVIESLKTNISLSPPTFIDILANSGLNPNVIYENTFTGKLLNPKPKSSSENETIDQSTELGKLYIKCKEILDKSTQPVIAGCLAEFYNLNNKDILRQKFEDPSATLYYIRLGSLFKWMEEKLLPKFEFNSDYLPIIKFDYTTENNLIYVLSSDYSWSSDPTTCLVKSSVILDEKYYTIANEADDFRKELSGSQVGQLMNVYLNFNSLLDIFNNNKDSEGKVTLIKFLQTICKSINLSLGNVNSLEPAIDETNNKIIIIDQNSLPNRDGIIKLVSSGSNTNLAVFQLYGYDFSTTGSVKGNFVQDFSLKTSVTPQLASMITIGATSQGYVVGEDATALSRINRGLKDRISPNIVEADYANTPALQALDTAFNKFTAQAELLVNYIKTQFSTNNSIPKLSSNLINDTKTTLCNTIELGEAYSSISQSIINTYNASNTSGFLPFNLSLTIDGLSGMKVYQKFTVDNDYLPTNYPESLEFIVTSINNNIQDNKWITQIESLALPKVTSVAKLNSGTLPKLPTRVTSNTTGDQFTKFIPTSNERISINNLQTGQNASLLIKYYEGITLVDGLAYPRLDKIGKVWDIGYGTRFIAGNPVTPQTPPITEAQASSFILDLIKSDFAPAVKKAIKVPLTQNEFDALVVFTYNVGPGNLADSTLVKLINQKKYVEAANEFLKFNKSKGVEIPGLSRRRRNEKLLFEKDSPGNK
jgi:GH24 family phage-related lysozyme (muramidase)